MALFRRQFGVPERQQVLEPELGPDTGHPHPERAAGFHCLTVCSWDGVVVGQDVGPLLGRQLVQGGFHRGVRLAGQQPVLGPVGLPQVGDQRCRRGPAGRRSHVGRDHVAGGDDAVRQDGLRGQPVVRAQQALQAVLDQVVDVRRICHPRGHHPADDRFDRYHILGRGCERKVLHDVVPSPPPAAPVEASHTLTLRFLPQLRCASPVSRLTGIHGDRARWT